jgi:hypothetical protein
MAGTQVLCRLCRERVPSKRALSLFSTISSKQKWGERITSLLEVTVCKNDPLPPHICSKCKNKILALERAASDLAAFKALAKATYAIARGPLKRTKDTSGDVGVSPDTARERPRTKLARKRLHFPSKATTDLTHTA